MSTWYNVGNFEEAVLASAVDTTATEFTIVAPTGDATFSTPPALVLIANSLDRDDLKAGEIVVISSNMGYTYSMTRTDPQDWSAGALVLGNCFAEHLEQITTEVDRMKWAGLYAVGGSDLMKYGVVRTGLTTDATTDFKIIPTPSQNNKVTVYGGFCYINASPIHIDSTATSTLTLSEASEEYSVFVHDDETIDATAGYTPGAVYTDKFLLGVVTTDTTARQLVVGDINDERIFF